MISRGIALLFGAFALAGCCASGQGCYAPVSSASFQFEPPEPVSRTAEHEELSKRISHKSQIIVEPLNPTVEQRNAFAQSGDKWEEEQAADREADAKLSSQLKICRGC
jgi:hypothetical protein